MDPKFNGLWVPAMSQCQQTKVNPKIRFVSCQPGVELLYLVDGELASEAGVAWMFSTQESVDALNPEKGGSIYPDLIGAWGTVRSTTPGAGVKFSDGRVYTEDAVFNTVEEWREHLRAGAYPNA